MDNQELISVDAIKPQKVKKPRKQRDPNAPRKLSAMQQFVIKHVSGMTGNRDAGEWKKQAKLFSILSKIYGSDFLLWVPPPEGYKVTDLSIYRSVFGKNYLSDQLVEYAKFKGVSQEKKEEIVLTEAKIGEDIFSGQKPRTLKEFLKYGQETRNPN